MHRPVGASGAAIRLAGEGVFKDAFAGKPGSYRFRVSHFSSGSLVIANPLNKIAE